MSGAAEPRPRRLEEFVQRPRRALWSLALPIMAGMSLHTLYMLTDMVFVGWVGPDALAALAFNMPVVFLAIGVVFGLGSGVTAVVARHVGAGDAVEAGRSAEHALGLGLVLSLLFTAAGWTWGRPILRAMGVPDELLEPAWGYFRVLTGGYVFLVMSVFFRSILAGEGDVRVPMAIQGVGTLLNACLDPLFIFTFDMGVVGAAIATVVAQALSTAAFVYLLFFRGGSFVRFDLRRFRFRPAVLAGITAVGVPASVSFVVTALGAALFNRLLAGFSADMVAAYQVGQRLDHVFLLPVIALAASLVTLVGMFEGAGRLELVREILGYALLRAVALSAAIGIVFFLAAPALVALFTRSPEIRAAGVGYLRIAVLGYPFVAVAMLAARALQGLGRGLPMLVLTLLRVLLIGVPLAAVGVTRFAMPVSWVWVSMLIGAVTAALLGAVLLARTLHARERAPAAASEAPVAALPPTA